MPALDPKTITHAEMSALSPDEMLKLMPGLVNAFNASKPKDDGEPDYTRLDLYREFFDRANGLDKRNIGSHSEFIEAMKDGKRPDLYEDEKRTPDDSRLVRFLDWFSRSKYPHLGSL